MLTKYYKAVIAFVVPLIAVGTYLGTNPEVVAVAGAPAAWLLAVGVPALTGVLAFLKRNAQTVEQIDKGLESGDVTLSDLQNVLARWKQDR